MQIIRDFFDAMNSRLGENGFDLQIIDLEEDGKPTGTHVIIQMPLTMIL